MRGLFSAIAPRTLLAALTLLAAGEARADERLRWLPERPRGGELVRLEVAAAGATTAVARLGGHRFRLAPGPRGVLEGYAALPIEAEPGTVELEVRLGAERLRVALPVSPREDEATELSVGKSYTSSERPTELDARIERDRAEMRAVWAALPDPPRALTRPRSPVKRVRVTERYGTKRTFNGEVSSRHYGLDLAGKVGVPVQAVLPGRVVLSALHFYSGGTVVLDHGGGLFTLYFHLSERTVRAGQRVAAGARIGAVGRTGRVTGPHLHLSVAIRAEPEAGGPPRGLFVDPEPFLAGAHLPEQGPRPAVAAGEGR